MAKKCNFCGRSEREVRLLITGLDGNICEDCAVQAYQVATANGVWTATSVRIVLYRPIKWLLPTALDPMPRNPISNSI